MRFFNSVILFAGLSLAAPIEQGAQAEKAPQADHPAVAQLNYVSQQFGTVVTEINQWDGSPQFADQVIRHAQETLKTLASAIQDVKRGPSFDGWTTLQLVSPLTNLDLQVHQLATALKGKKQVSDKVQLSPVIFNLLKQTHAEASDLCAGVVEKLPMGVSAVVNVLSTEIVSTLAGVRDLYKPEMDVTVIIADPNRPASGGFQVRPTGNNAPYPPENESHHSMEMPPMQEEEQQAYRGAQGYQGSQEPQGNQRDQGNQGNQGWTSSRPQQQQPQPQPQPQAPAPQPQATSSSSFWDFLKPKSQQSPTPSPQPQSSTTLFQPVLPPVPRPQQFQPKEPARGYNW